MGLLLIYKSEAHGNRRHPDTVYKRKSVREHFCFQGIEILCENWKIKGDSMFFSENEAQGIFFVYHCWLIETKEEDRENDLKKEKTLCVTVLKL